MGRRHLGRPLVVCLGVQAVLAAVAGGACSPGGPSGEFLGGTTPMTTADSGADSAQVGAGDGSSDALSADASRADVLTDATGNPADGRPVDGPSSDRGDRDAGDSATSDGPGPSGDGGADAGPTVPVCNPAIVWAPVFRIPSLPQDTFARMGGIGVDELTIAWTSATGTIYIADRPTRADAFGAPTSIDTTDAGVAVDRVGLSATGLAVFAVSADRTHILGFDRAGAGAGAGAPWSPSSPLPLANVNAMASTEQSSEFSEPVLGADGRSFFFLLGPAGSPPILYESTYDAPSRAWSSGLPHTEFAADSAASVTYATGVSSDGLTLFFYDGTRAIERAAWRDTVTSPFSLFADMPSVPEAAPNFLCTTIYSRGPDPVDDAGGEGALIAQPR